jgi:tetratricopeptide (TPR) repeat protein
VKYLPFLLALVSYLSNAQETGERTLFQEAESWFYYEEYEEALPLYDSLLQGDPNNDNLQYKYGVCLLNDPYQQEKAISYLEDAGRGLRRDYKENSYRERRAPTDVVYHLASAYLANEMLDKARDTYEAFLIIMDRDQYDDELVWDQIRACETAAKLMKEPVKMELHPLDTSINSPYPEIMPVVSGDGTVMTFVRKLPFFDAAYMSRMGEQGWSRPRLITQELGYEGDIYPTGLSHDGTEMILYSDDNRTGNLYYSRYENGSWNEAVKMGAPISTRFWESHGCLSKDGKTLYFTSNREGGQGGLDIYRSEKQRNGEWGEPVNLGPEINSPYNEQSPWISSDGRTMYFISFGHEKMGGYDIFFARQNPDGSWGKPVNPGYPVNTTGDDLYLAPLNNSSEACYAIFQPGGNGGHDIYRLILY